MASRGATAVGRVVGSVVLFIGAIGLCIGLVFANASVSPTLVWFPLPVLTLIVAIAAWSERQFGVGLQWPVPLDPRTLLMTTGIAVFGVAACVLQGALAGLTRVAETGPPGTSPLFQFSYAVLLSVAPAALAEVAFRGVMQTGLTKLGGAWPAILVVAAINTAAHRWDPELGAQWAAYFVSLAAAGWLRSVTGSLWPPMIAHVSANFLTALALWHWGPFAQGRIGGAGLAVVAALALGGLLLAAWLAFASCGTAVRAHLGTAQPVTRRPPRTSN
ncbi:MAG: type II CAAX endopeptidase family protein [Gammaproteobacteria bacterium]